MITGANTNIRHRDKLFHVQTEVTPQADELYQQTLAETVDPKITDPFPIVDCVSSSAPDLSGDPVSAGTKGHADFCAWHKNNSNERNNYWDGTGTYRNLCYLHACELDCNPGNPPA